MQQTKWILAYHLHVLKSYKNRENNEEDDDEMNQKQSLPEND